jgi:hypothetical protein
MKLARCFDEARHLGVALAASPNIAKSDLVADLVHLDQYFEVPQSAEEEAVHILIGGVVAALEADAGYPRNGDGDDD